MKKRVNRVWISSSYFKDGEISDDLFDKSDVRWDFIKGFVLK